MVVDVWKPVRKIVRLLAPFYYRMSAMVQYEWVPHHCFHCGCMDHTISHCLVFVGEPTKE